jgi:hypothetical protein
VGWACGIRGRRQKSVQGFGGEDQRKEILGRPRRLWKDEIIMDLREIGWRVDWILLLAQDRDRWRDVVSALMNLPVLAPRS